MINLEVSINTNVADIHENLLPKILVMRIHNIQWALLSQNKCFSVLAKEKNICKTGILFLDLHQNMLLVLLRVIPIQQF